MCDERERLIGFIYDECDAGERRTIEEHVEACPTCRTEIAALRDVREDLLAWRVPVHEPIWRPLPVAATPVAPWWRQVPAWALAAAASVMFFSGVAGGAIAAAWLRPASAPVSARVTDDRPVVTAQQLTQTEQRILQLMRQELSGIDQRVQRVQISGAGAPRAVSASFPTAFAEQLRGLEASTEARDRLLLDAITSTSNDLATVRKVVRDEVLAELRAGGVQSGGGGGSQYNR